MGMSKKTRRRNNSPKKKGRNRKKKKKQDAESSIHVLLARKGADKFVCVITGVDMSFKVNKLMLHDAETHYTCDVTNQGKGWIFKREIVDSIKTIWKIEIPKAALERQAAAKSKLKEKLDAKVLP